MAVTSLALNLTCFLSTTTSEQRNEMRTSSPTLLITNTGGPPIKVYLHSFGGSRQMLTGFLGTNQKACVYLPRSSYDYYLVVENMDGAWSSSPFTPIQASAWKWEINGDPGFDVLRLMPDVERCKP